MQAVEKIDIRVKRTYKQLIQSFMMLLNQKSFDDISISEICENAKVHRATFYKHFEDKTEFLNFCVNKLLSDTELTNLANFTSSENVKESCMSFVKIVFNFVEKNKLIFAAVFSDKLSPSFDTALTKVVTEFCANKLQIVLSGIPANKAQLFSNFYAGSIIGVIKWYVGNYDICPLEDIFSFLEHRVDEICDAYIKYYLEDNKDKLI